MDESSIEEDVDMVESKSVKWRVSDVFEDPVEGAEKAGLLGSLFLFQRVSLDMK